MLQATVTPSLWIWGDSGISSAFSFLSYNLLWVYALQNPCATTEHHNALDPDHQITARLGQGPEPPRLRSGSGRVFVGPGAGRTGRIACGTGAQHRPRNPGTSCGRPLGAADGNPLVREKRRG